MMVKKLFVVLIMMVLVSMGFANTAMAKGQADNPIDQAFAQDFCEAMNTIEMNYVSEKYMDAWKAEMKNVAAVLKQSYVFTEDKAHVDVYVASYEKVAESAGYIEWLNWSDAKEDPNHRSFGTGAASASLSAKANIYKQATINLIDAYHGQAGDNSLSYTYVYSGKGADLAKVRDQHRQ